MARAPEQVGIEVRDRASGIASGVPVPVDCSVHVTLRVRVDVPSLRTVAFVREFRRSLAEACERGGSA